MSLQVPELKQYYEIWPEMKIFTFHLLYHIEIMKWFWISPYFKSTMYSYRFLCIKLKYSVYSFSCTILQNECYRDPDKRNIMADSVITTTPLVFIFARYCLFTKFYRFMSTIENLLGKMYIEGVLMSKSRNIALNTQVAPNQSENTWWCTHSFTLFNRSHWWWGSYSFSLPIDHQHSIK